MVKSWDNGHPIRPLPPRQSLLQLSVIVILIIIFIYIAYQQIWRLRTVAEKRGAEYLVATLKSALGNEMAIRVVRGGVPSLIRLEGSNPIALLDSSPTNYLGEFETIDPATLPGNRWYFDRSNGTLVYRVAFDDHFATPLEGASRIRFRVQVDYDDENGNRHLDYPRESIRGLSLRQLDPYRWEVE